MSLNDGLGLDKDARKAKERLEKAVEEAENAPVVPPLDPPFPYRVVEFDPDFFRL